MAIIATPAHAGAVEVTGESDWWFTLDGTTEILIYGNSNRDCEEPGADPYLWLYDSDGVLLMYDDDSNHGLGQCFSSKLFTTLDAGQYRVHAGYCCSQREAGYNGGTYELVSQLAAFGTTTTSTTTTTTTSTTSTTTTSTTTTTLPPTTTSTSTSTTTVLETTTTTTLPPTTTVPLPPTTTSTSTTTTTPTTLPPTTTTTSTTEGPLPATTTSSSTTTTSSTFSTSTTTSSSTTTTTTLPATTTTSAPTQTTSTLPTPPADASDAEKQQFEQTINIYSTPGYDNYVPAGSTVTVATRRTVTAAAVVLGTVPTFAPRRRNR